LDKENNEPFWGAGVTFNSEKTITDDEGVVQYTVLEGEYEFSTDKTNYYQETGTLNIISDTTIIIYLTRSHAYAKFQLYEENTPVNNVVVKIDANSIISSSLGIANFVSLPVSETYNYLISKTGYTQENGTFLLKTDTTIKINMEKEIVNSIENRESNIKIWPNPVSDYLNIDGKNLVFDSNIAVMDMMGSILNNYQANNNLIRIDVQDYPAGLYLLRLPLKNEQYIIRFIKE
jgi:hypothetical protein